MKVVEAPGGTALIVSPLDASGGITPIWAAFEHGHSTLPFAPTSADTVGRS